MLHSLLHFLQKLPFFRGFSHFRQFYMNYHWRVFRATRDRALLTISDWSSNQNPGGPSGQELMFNFIEVQPYFAD